MKKPKRIKMKSQQQWTWVLLAVYVLLTLLLPAAGMLGLICMLVPIALAAFGQGKMHCSHLCPRGSAFSRWLRMAPWPRLTPPQWMKSTLFKVTLMVLMFGRFIWLLAASWGDWLRMASGIGGFMMMSMVVGAIMGLIFPARTWCQVCPMGMMSTLVDKGLYPKAKG